MEPLLDPVLFIVTTKQTLFDEAVVDEQLNKYNLTTDPQTRCTINLILSSYWTKT